MDNQAKISHRTNQYYSGCLLGGAIGDALGAAVEFDSIREIRNTYGPNGIKDYASAYGRKGAITDDTQMTLFTAEGLVRAHRLSTEDVDDALYVRMVHQAYLRWLHTQGEISAHQDFYTSQDGWLLKIKELHQRRVPGNSCLTALMSTRMGTMELPINNSKGCGGVMRAAPVGLCGAAAMGISASGNNLEAIFTLGCQTAAITHGHPSGYLPAGCLAAMIAFIILGHTLEEAVQNALIILKKFKGQEETYKALQQALELANATSFQPCPETIELMGGGWVGEEALAISIYCALAAKDDFGTGVCLAVNHSGDSDSTGAITGNILGAMYGQASIPQRWFNHLELKTVIERVAEELVFTHQLQ